MLTGNTSRAFAVWSKFDGRIYNVLFDLFDKFVKT